MEKTNRILLSSSERVFEFRYELRSRVGEAGRKNGWREGDREGDKKGGRKKKEKKRKRVLESRDSRYHSKAVLRTVSK